MATTIGPGSGSTLIFSRGSHIKMAEQTVVGTAIADKDAFSKYTYALNTGSLSPQSTLLTPGVIPTGVEQFKGIAGPATVTGAFTIDAYAKRMELPFRQLLNAPTAGITYAKPGSGTAQVIIAPTALSSSMISSGFTAPDEAQGPVQIAVALSGTVTIGGTAISTTNPARLLIKGTDVNDNQIVNELSFTGTGSQTTGSYFKTVTAVVGIGTVVGSVGLQGTSNRSEVTIQSATNYRQTPGMTLSFVTGSGTQGSIPNTVSDAYINTMTLNVTRDAIATYNFGVTARAFALGLNPEMGGVPLGTTGGTVRSNSGTTGPYGDGNFLSMQRGQTPFAGLATRIEAESGGSQVRLSQLESLTLTLDNGTAFTGRIGSQFPGIPYNTQRTISLEWSMEYHSDDKDIARAYFDERTLDNVNIYLTRLGGGNEETVFQIPRMQFSEFPVISVDNPEYLRSTVRGIALPTANSNSSDAIKIIQKYDYFEGTTSPTASTLSLAGLTP